MDFGTRPKQPREGGMVPMINVVFLLLVFFLMVATIAPPDPFAAEPPRASAGAAPERAEALHLGPDGALAYGAARGEAALAAVPLGEPLFVRADAGLPASDLAALLARLAGAGVTEVRLAVDPR